MKKRLLTVAIVIGLILLAALISVLSYLSTKHSNTNSNNIQSEETVDEPLYLKVHFGNGEIYQTELEKLWLSPHGAPPVATLKNGYRYCLTEYYKFERIEEEETWIVYFWRDEPYSLEKEHFKKIN